MNIENFYINPPSLTINISISEAQAIIESLRYEYEQNDNDERMLHPLALELEEVLDTLGKIKDASKE